MTEREKAIAFNRQTKEALTLVYTELNQGQQKKLLKNMEVRELLERYGVIADDGEKSRSGFLTED